MQPERQEKSSLNSTLEPHGEGEAIKTRFISSQEFYRSLNTFFP